MQHPVWASLIWSVLIIVGLPHPGGPQVPLGDGLTATRSSRHDDAPGAEAPAAGGDGSGASEASGPGGQPW